MAARKTSEKTEKTTSTTKPNDYIEFKLPQVSKSKTIPLLIFLLLVLSFIVGYQTAKVTYWEQKEKSLTGLSANNGGVQPTPTPSFYDVKNGHLPLLGKSSAKVTIVEFSDLQCLFCRRFWKDTLPQIKKDYIDKGLVKLAYRQYPLPPELHPAARDLSEAAECANDQNKFWEFHDQAFSEQEKQGEGTIPVTTEDINGYASAIGLDMTAFSSCFTAKKDAAKIDTDMSDGQKVNVSSTPTFYVNGQIIVGALPYASFKTIIDEQLKK